MAADSTLADCPRCGCAMEVALVMGIVVDVNPFDDTPKGLMDAMLAANKRQKDEEYKNKEIQAVLRDVGFGDKLQKTCDLLARQEYEQALKYLRTWYAEELSIGQRSVLDLYLGNVYKDTDRIDEARAYYDMAITKARVSQYPPRSATEQVEAIHLTEENARYLDVEAAALGNLGSLYAVTGEMNIAEAYLVESLQIYRLLEDALGQANQLFVLGHIYSFQRKVSAAVDCLNEATRLFKELGNTDKASRAQAEIRELRGE